ncbi:carboxylesterase [Pseudoroseicyclus sp. CLL3-39]|uniref:Carboxylesterase n=1 Tax=Pseudoroseicyclus tamaricis TaxID=2705421 RepID=A0A6B2K136_9RHOB|nr:carboxylesterase [Pseudoroseicyclus tamaricis]
MIGTLVAPLVGAGPNVIRETAEVFRVNAENADARAAAGREASLRQFAAEFGHARRGRFDRAVDGLNRLPRPLMAFGTIGMLVAAMAAPEWFAARMGGLAAVPEPLWWLMGAIVSFYFGARYQTTAQQFQRAVVGSLAASGTVSATASSSAGVTPERGDENPALAEWREQA